MVFYIDTTINPSYEIKTKIHIRHHIRGILKKSTFIVVTTDTKGVTEFDTNNHFPNNCKKAPILSFYPVRSLGSHRRYPTRTDRKSGIHRIRPWP